MQTNLKKITKRPRKGEVKAVRFKGISFGYKVEKLYGLIRCSVETLRPISANVFFTCSVSIFIRIPHARRYLRAPLFGLGLPR